MRRKRRKRWWWLGEAVTRCAAMWTQTVKLCDVQQCVLKLWTSLKGAIDSSTCLSYFTSCVFCKSDRLSKQQMLIHATSIMVIFIMIETYFHLVGTGLTFVHLNLSSHCWKSSLIWKFYKVTAGQRFEQLFKTFRWTNLEYLHACTNIPQVQGQSSAVFTVSLKL